MSAIDDKYAAWGGAAGFLGKPVGDEQPITLVIAPIGRYRDYQNGSIYWRPSLGAWVIHGAIRDYWRAENGVFNPDFGFPISDEIPIIAADPAGLTSEVGRFQNFENTVVRWLRRLPNEAAYITPVNWVFVEPAFTAGDDPKHPLTYPVPDGGSIGVADMLVKFDSFVRQKAPAPATVQSVALEGLVEIGPRPVGVGNKDPGYQTLFHEPVTDYANVNGTVSNRLYKVHCHLGGPGGLDGHLYLWIAVEPAPDASDNRIRTRLTINISLVWWHLDYKMERIAEWAASVVGAKSVDEIIHGALDPLTGHPVQQIQTEMPSEEFLGVKVMLNGDLNIYAVATSDLVDSSSPTPSPPPTKPIITPPTRPPGSVHKIK